MFSAGEAVPHHEHLHTRRDKVEIDVMEIGKSQWSETGIIYPSNILWKIRIVHCRNILGWLVAEELACKDRL